MQTVRPRLMHACIEGLEKQNLGGNKEKFPSVKKRRDNKARPTSVLFLSKQAPRPMADVSKTASHETKIGHRIQRLGGAKDSREGISQN